jgi:hypothetical protein
MGSPGAPLSVVTSIVRVLPGAAEEDEVEVVLFELLEVMEEEVVGTVVGVEVELVVVVDELVFKESPITAPAAIITMITTTTIIPTVREMARFNDM